MNVIKGFICLLCLLSWACSNNLVDMDTTVPINRDGKLVLQVGVENMDLSRLIYNQKYSYFSEGDKIGILFNSDISKNISFTVDAKGNTMTSDIPLIVNAGDSIYGYYPYNEDVENVKELPLSITSSQVQKDTNFSHVTLCDYLVASPISISKNNTRISMARASTAIDFVVHNTYGTSIDIHGATIKSSKKAFVKTGYIDITSCKGEDNYLKVIPQTFTDEISIVAEGDWATGIENGKKVTLRMSMLPSDLTNDTLMVKVYTSVDTITQYIRGDKLESGNIYQFVYGGKEIYLPKDAFMSPSEYVNGFNFDAADLHDPNSHFCWARSRQSDNYIVFWEPGFGNDPSTCNKMISGVSMRVDIDRLLEKLEQYGRVYTDKLKFVIPGYSFTDRYKMMVFLLYTKEWVALGGEEGKTIGCFWVSPSSTNPIGHPVAHELGHSYHNQANIDHLYDTNYVYHAKSAGYFSTTFWELTAQYLALHNYSDFPDWDCNIPAHLSNSNKGFTHHWTEYDSYHQMRFWEEKHGIDIVSKLWRFTGQSNEDPIEAYMRYTNTSIEEYNNEAWWCAAKEQTWDFGNDEIDNLIRSKVDRVSSSDRDRYYINNTALIHNIADDYYRSYPDNQTSYQGSSARYALTPQAYGYNSVQLNVPEQGTEIQIDFEGIEQYPQSEKYGDYKYATNLGWRWGIVASTGDGGWTPVYSEMQAENKGTIKFVVPEDTKRLAFVVSGAPGEHIRKDANSNREVADVQFPYRFKVTGTTINTSYIRVSTEEVNYSSTIE